MAAARVSFTWMGTQKTLTPEQKARAAETFGAEGQYLSAGKKLIDTSHAAFRAVTAIRGKVDAYWRGLSLPFPEPGVRLIRHDVVEPFAAQMADFRAELDDAVANLDRHYGELKQAARERLGSLFNPSDYPETLVGLFGGRVGVPQSSSRPTTSCSSRPGSTRPSGPGSRPGSRRPSSSPSRRSSTSSPGSSPTSPSGSRASARTASPGSSATRPSATCQEFFDRFRSLNVRLERPARRPGRRGPAGGPGRRRPGPPRRRGGLRQDVAAQLTRVRTSLDAMLVERPRRRILRQRPGGGA